MDGIRHRERFAEIEALMDSYFRCHIAPVMSKTRTYLTEKQGEEMMEYSTSPGGILSLMASSMQPLADPYQVLKATGEWNSKTTEDYIEMCKAEIAGSEAMQQDLAYMAERWREAVVQEVGRERYDELSRVVLISAFSFSSFISFFGLLCKNRENLYLCLSIYKKTITQWMN